MSMNGYAGDLKLEDGEHEDIREEAKEVVGESWLYEPNTNLGGQTPNQVIEEGRIGLVRGVIRTIKYIGFS
jgi:hypothetical protein